MHWSSRLVLVILAGIGHPALAQDPVPDTLDWHGYMPLAVGNQWQYEGETEVFGLVERWYEQWEIVGDTLHAGNPFYLLEKSCKQVDFNESYPFSRSCDSEDTTTHVIGYDEIRARVVERRFVAADSTEETFWFGFGFRFNAPFWAVEEPLDDPYGSGYFYERGTGPVGLAGVSEEITLKGIMVASGIPTDFLFAHGVGLLGTGSNEGGSYRISLAYARIGDTEFGAALPLANETETPGREEAGRLAIYPNPATDRVVVVYSILQPAGIVITLSDALGRVVERWDHGRQFPGDHEATLEPTRGSSGVYQLSVERDGVRVATRAVVLIR